tara:strand:+ start:3310 stop:3522 length:213 start_codon:yes stop_codon:yes gene_type:complete
MKLKNNDILLNEVNKLTEKMVNDRVEEILEISKKIFNIENELTGAEFIELEKSKRELSKFISTHILKNIK